MIRALHFHTRRSWRLAGIAALLALALSFVAFPLQANGQTQAGNACQLGNGATSSSSTPVTVTGVVLASVNIGGWTSCGQTPSGAGYCWGWGHYGDRGDGTGADAQPTPSAIAGSTTFASISPGSYHACALATNGAVWCWGYNVDGELGNGTTTDSAVPVRVTSP